MHTHMHTHSFCRMRHTSVCAGAATAAGPAASGSCDESTWPDKDHGLVCGECKVLVNRFKSHYKTCNGYCQAIGNTCVQAWEEQGDTCTVQSDLRCDQKLGSSDAICQCSPDGNPPCRPVLVISLLLRLLSF